MNAWCQWLVVLQSQVQSLSGETTSLASTASQARKIECRYLHHHASWCIAVTEVSICMGPNWASCMLCQAATAGSSLSTAIQESVTLLRPCVCQLVSGNVSGCTAPIYCRLILTSLQSQISVDGNTSWSWSLVLYFAFRVHVFSSFLDISGFPTLISAKFWLINRLGEVWFLWDLLWVTGGTPSKPKETVETVASSVFLPRQAGALVPQLLSTLEVLWFYPSAIDGNPNWYMKNIIELYII